MLNVTLPGGLNTPPVPTDVNEAAGRSAPCVTYEYRVAVRYFTFIRKFRTSIWLYPWGVGCCARAFVGPETSAMPAAAPATVSADINCLRVTAKPDSLFSTFSVVAADSRTSNSLLAISTASLSFACSLVFNVCPQRHGGDQPPKPSQYCRSRRSGRTRPTRCPHPPVIRPNRTRRRESGTPSG